MADSKTGVAVLGATGYVGGELLRLLAGHPEVRVTHATSERSAGRKVAEVFPALAGAGDLTLQALDTRAVARDADLVLAALPHGRGAAAVEALVEAGRRVIDLSADHRLPDPAAYRAAYGADAAHPALASEAVYGLPEFTRERLSKARLVGVPGCYPTATLLGLLPMLVHGLIDPEDGVVVDAKSGVSGAGREARTESLFAEVTGGVRPYHVGTHRHQPEMAFHAGALSGRDVNVLFTPQVVPMSRGLLAAVYGRLAADVDPEAVRARFVQTYAEAPFVQVLEAGRWPETRWVTGTNRAVLGVGVDAPTRRAIALCAIDNLGKGAAGQAVQCMNLVLGFDEAAGLTALAGVA